MCCMETVQNGLPAELLWLPGRAGLPGRRATAGNVDGRDRTDVLPRSVQAAGPVSAAGIRTTACHA